ncbi:response regulator [Sphingomonas sp.]|uniref:response regulator n=1 Tax=Sphingomonas sp. TaxID=28214 RepID=UPI001B1E4F2E|nr:response regulator [Sphingomonas sp.]MBO9713458.1 response regulator [Sphingomonas sp.]
MTRGHVELVDDDAAMRDSTALLLGMLGYTVRTWAEAAEFLSVAEDGAQTCALIDLRMPKMNGFELTRGLRGRGLAIPIILFTGHCDQAIRDEAALLGIAAILEKPFSADELIDAVVQVIPTA